MRALVIAALFVSVAFGQKPILLTGPPADLLQKRAPFPEPPYYFVEEDKSGRSPKVLVRDARGHTWELKFGDEVKAEVFATRLVSAVGYFSDVTHYVESGAILGTRQLTRAAQHIDEDGRFKSARFEYRNPSLRFFKDTSWAWDKNPFGGSREFNGLRILVMLLSNWDNKDATDKFSNTGIMERRGKAGRDLIYYVADWGGSMGNWGRKFSHNKWDCEDFADQSRDFIRDVNANGDVEFGFSSGNHDGDFKDNIRVSDVAWLLKRFDGITELKLRRALLQSGATAHEAQHFAAALRLRMQQMENVAAMRRQSAAPRSPK